jgi:NADPH2:quinone reductase
VEAHVNAVGANTSARVLEAVLVGVSDPAAIQLRTRPLFAPGVGEALVRIEASGVSFAERAMRRGRYPGQPRFPFVPGYDFVGTVLSVGEGVDDRIVGTRVAAVIKVGGWSTHVLVNASTLVSVPGGIRPEDAETVLVDGVTAWQMLFRKARGVAGQTILVHGASGCVGTVLCQLARNAGMRVIGTAAPRHHDALMAAGVEPLDYSAADLELLVRQNSPGGLDAVFDHLGIESARVSFRLLAPGGTLVCYGNATALDGDQSLIKLFFALVAQIACWNILPNSRRATFYNFWGGSLINPRGFRGRMRDDLESLFDLLLGKAIRPVIAACVPLTDIAEALSLSESRSLRGKVVISMDTQPD